MGRGALVPQVFYESGDEFTHLGAVIDDKYIGHVTNAFRVGLSVVAYSEGKALNENGYLYHIKRPMKNENLVPRAKEGNE